jgi:cytochrome c oxidase cbb3-type subunit 1
MFDYLKLVILGVVVVCAAIAANYARDAAYLVHMLLFMAVGGGLFLYTLRRMGEPVAPVPTHEYMESRPPSGASSASWWAPSSPSSWPFRSSTSNGRRAT